MNLNGMNVCLSNRVISTGPATRHFSGTEEVLGCRWAFASFPYHGDGVMVGPGGIFANWVAFQITHSSGAAEFRVDKGFRG